MCCLFGILDHHASLSVQQRTKLLSVLATQSEVRGRDATGIAYNSGGQLRIFKRACADALHDRVIRCRGNIVDMSVVLRNERFL